MTRYIVLLRGVNISGQKLIKMEELRTVLKKAGFKDVQTYIQSGNIVFNYEELPLDKIEVLVKGLLKSHWGYDVSVFVLTPEILKKVIEDNPFADDPVKSERTYFTFLNAAPDETGLSKLKEIDCSPEEAIHLNKTIYFFSPNSYGKAKMNNNFFEKILKLPATTRNRNTVNKLLEMALPLADGRALT